jgi:hypothetical protein
VDSPVTKAVYDSHMTIPTLMRYYQSIADVYPKGNTMRKDSRYAKWSILILCRL